uniref:Uncharacterized protein n=1 Tax=Periophthalmus magnuspinnatus TaxID=409849 RepID=A0A3B4AH42_9GOBI
GSACNSASTCKHFLKRDICWFDFRAIPACTSNRATRVDLPVSIVIEKLMPLPEEHTFEDSSKSSISFTVLSEEQLNAAVKLAKRDLRRRRLDSLNRSSPKHMQKSSLLETTNVVILGEPLEPDEQSKLDIRKQKQAARSTSIIYALQHQVSDYYIELAAAHRGALRALHVFIQHLSNTTHCTNLPNFKDLGQLIRQLCLCSTKAELNEGSAVPQSAHGILQMLEVRLSVFY